MVKRLVCALIGHKWALTDVCHRSWMLRHLSRMAGREGFCLRCNAMWYDSCGDCQRGRLAGGA